MLLIDLGNSRLKWVQVVGGQWQAQGAEVHDGLNLPAAIREQWQVLDRPSLVCVSCVAGESIKTSLCLWLEQVWGLVPRFIGSQSGVCGVTSRYRELKKLGVDRWLALVGARSQAPALVVDCGTAVTIDVLDAEGVHQGGIILPGIALMQSALLGKASGIQSAALTGSFSANFELGLGRDTQEGIALGAHYAVAGAIEHFEQVNKAKIQGYCRIITGGDAAVVQSALKPEYHTHSHLVLTGLQIVASQYS